MRVPKWLLLLICVAVVLVGFAFKTLWDAGEFKRLSNLRPGPCRSIGGVWSSEDITVDFKLGLALISSADRRQGRQGAIFSLDLQRGTDQVRNLTSDLSLEFHPHGISLYQPDSGPGTLFVVNHRRDGHFVEIFEYDRGRLEHKESIASELMHSPNDVLGTGPRSFYVTVDHKSRSNIGKLLEEFLQLSRSYVLYYDGSSFSPAATGLAYANGIAASRDGRRVYVGASIGRGVWAYERPLGESVLKPLFVIDLNTGVDNLEVDEEGNLWVGAHPRLLTFTDYATDPEVLSPSEVLKISFFMERDFEVQRVFLDTGEFLSGSSVGAVYSDQLLIGSVYDPRLLVCELSP